MFDEATIAALFTTASNRPKVFIAVCTNCSCTPSVLKSSICSTAFSSPNCATTSLPHASSRPWTTTFAPSATHRIAMAFPMPVVLPVTMMTLFFNLILYGFEYTFYNTSIMHLFKSLVPFCNGPHPTDDRFYIQRSTGKQRNHSFPNRPVMAEAALQRNIFCTNGSNEKPSG